jgi:aspartyl-tRNA(Asn)/glutamyl-tRNA(Gln) amidotransferase subunit C
MNEEGVKKLAQLSRLELSPEEVSEYSGEISEILTYIDSLKDAVSDIDPDIILENSTNRNVMREDENPHESGINTDKIIASAPDTQDGHIKVKKIL